MGQAGGGLCVCRWSIDVMRTDEIFLEEIEDAIEDGKLDLTSFEEDFVDSIRDKIDSGRDLTRKQREVLDQIHSKIRAW